jgi:RNA polymerase sigma-70 factor (ECF subfamily)
MRSDFSIYADKELLQLLAQSQETALGEIYSRYWESLYNKAFNFLRSVDAAKDCVQEVFVWLWIHRETVSIENLNSYLHQATRFQALKALRENKAAPEFDNRLTVFSNDILGSEALEYKELKDYLEKLINALPEDQRLIFKLHREESLTYNEIAQKLGISVKTVEKKMSQSLRYLRSRASESAVLLLIILSIS